MRTTLTIDDELAARLRELAHRRKISFKAAVNDALRRGLSAPQGRRAARTRYRTATFESPFRPGVDPLRLNQLADELEARRFGGSR
jgi:Arc/MetJ family transcription regulator